jgi:hypothetical protein
MAAIASLLALTSVAAAWAGRHILFFAGPPPPALVKPRYWVAILALQMSEPEKDSFHPHLSDFREKIAQLLGPDGPDRCMYSKMMTRPNQACLDEQGKAVQNCEPIEVHWNDDTNEKPGWLKLLLREAGPTPWSGPAGEIFRHRCPMDTFEQCFENQLTRMEKAVWDHDTLCHEGCTTCIVNDKKEFVCQGQ